MIYSTKSKNGFKMPYPFDPDDVKIVGILYRPDTWSGVNVYYYRDDDDYDIVIPTTFAGMYYKCTNPGISGSVEPTWPTIIGRKVTDGTVIWEAVAYNMLPAGETIDASTWSASDENITLSNDAILSGKTIVTVSTVPSALETFTITNHITKSNGEENDTSLIFKVASR